MLYVVIDMAKLTLPRSYRYNNVAEKTPISKKMRNFAVMKANITDIKTVSDVRSFICEAIKYFQIYIAEEELYEKVVDIFSSVLAGVPRDLLMKMEQESYVDEDDYQEHISAYKKVYKHPKTVFERLYCGKSLFDQSNFHKHINVSDEELSILRDIEELGRKICKEYSYNYDVIVAEELEEFWDGATPWDYEEHYPDTYEEDAREANKLFYGEINDHEAWGNLD